jgi:Bacterial low temperature requirement A protein (LtrA)
VPGAFGRDGVRFGVAYFVVRALHLVLYAIAGRGDRDLFRAVLRIIPTATLAPALLVIAGFLDGSGQLALWGAALAIDYLGAMVGRMRGWRISPAHFVERFGLIIIIALGESIVAIGVGAAGLPLDPGVIAAALLGITVVACLWWSYFDWVIFVAQAALAEATGASRAALARDAYSYLHLPMVAGIVLFAFGLETTLHDVNDPLRIVPARSLRRDRALPARARRAAFADRRWLRTGTTGRVGPVAWAAPRREGGTGPHRPRPRCGRLRLPHRLRGHPVSRGARLDPQPSRRVHHGRGRPCRREPREERPSSREPEHMTPAGSSHTWRRPARANE